MRHNHRTALLAMQDTDPDLDPTLDEQGKAASVSALWPLAIKRYLLLRKDLHVLSYQELSDRLIHYEIHQNARNLSSKFNQGTFSASLFVASLLAMDEKSIDLRELFAIIEELGRQRATGVKPDISD